MWKSFYHNENNEMRNSVKIQHSVRESAADKTCSTPACGQDQPPIKSFVRLQHQNSPKVKKTVMEKCVSFCRKTLGLLIS